MEMGVSGEAPASLRRRAMHPRAFAGQKNGSLVVRCPVCSPRVAFFWSSNMRVALRMRPMEFESFKGASGAQWTVSSMVRWMWQKRKAWEWASVVWEWVHSAGRSNQKWVTMTRSMMCWLRTPSLGCYDEDVSEGAQDGDVDRVGSCLRVVFLSQGAEEISE